ncbi:HepT-like ribonuclease domain-containing protein [Rhodohalobacter sp. 8-1]|uniref:HepT-like ribonuclease domain-containing protein n=1 Tax=Rhodohalobacter sp. 8-1 TaxID=3131972 RepID=UPI0030EF6389
MIKSIKKYLFDIKTAIESIEEYVEPVDSFEEYQQNKLIRRAVEREIEIIGEATNRILKLDDSVNIAHARKIVDTRNWVIHGYDSVDDKIIWGVITKYLPKLKDEVEKLLSEKDRNRS